jgi:hypothetical protein
MGQARVVKMVSDATVLQLRGRVSSLEERLAQLTRGQHLLRSAQETLDEIAQLQDDWDSYGAHRPTAASISAAHLLLGSLWDELGHAVDDQAVPWAVAPLADGGVQCEWRGPGGAIEVEFGPSGTLNYLIEREEATVTKSDPSLGAGAEDVLHRIRRVLDR